MANQPRAIGLALITLLMWSTVATAFKLTLAYASVLQTLAVASVVSSLVLVILVVLSGKGAVLAGGFESGACDPGRAQRKGGSPCGRVLG